MLLVSWSLAQTRVVASIQLVQNTPDLPLKNTTPSKPHCSQRTDSFAATHCPKVVPTPSSRW